MAGSYLVAVMWLGGDQGIWMQSVRDIAVPKDLTMGLIKATVFGFLLTSISCRHGFFASGGARGVGLATTRAVVESCVAILIANYLLTQLILDVAAARGGWFQLGVATEGGAESATGSCGRLGAGCCHASLRAGYGRALPNQQRGPVAAPLAAASARLSATEGGAESATGSRGQLGAAPEQATADCRRC
jgi:hypothetical protein